MGGSRKVGDKPEPISKFVNLEILQNWLVERMC